MIALLWALLGCAGPLPAPADSCTSCHTERAPQPHAAVPCVACHLGHADAPTREAAHAGMELEPGALDTVDRTCACHQDEIARVRTLPMTTGRGIVGVDRYAFGESPTPDTEATLATVLASSAPSPADDHIRRLCAGCHLGARKDNRDDVRSGGSGCSACHAVAVQDAHPAVTAKVPDAQCQGCHSRSTRISLTYAGRLEGDCAAQLPDGRTICATEPDVHAQAGLACIDCHVHTELMGDGVSRAHQEEQVEIRCASCHVGPSAPAKLDDPVTQRLPHTSTVATGTRGTPLWNVDAEGLVGKLDGRRHAVKKVPADHAGRGHDRLTCSACHAAVAPTCTSCHTSYDQDGKQWDFGRGAEAAGRWVEQGPTEALLPPALGVGADDTIRPAIPGMVGQLAGRAVRLYALVEPHATRSPARTCTSCHASAWTLGLGTGTLDPETLRFTAAADDGWTTLDAATPASGTRTGARSLDKIEQRRILRVGVCLRCHEAQRVSAFPDLAKRPARCTLGAGWWNESLQ